MESQDLTMEKISTMSLGEFRNLLNNTLSVPNGTADSLCSSDSPRSQSSVESYKNSPSKGSKKDKWAHVKSSYSYRPPSAQKGSKSNTPVKNNVSSTSSGYSSSSVSSDRTAVNSYINGTKSILSHKSAANSSYKSGTRTLPNNSTRQAYNDYDHGRPKTPTSISKSRSNMTAMSDNSYASHTYGSRSSSHSSLKSYDSYDSHLLDETHVNYPKSERIPMTPSSVHSDYSNSELESNGYARSNSYTPCSGFPERGFGVDNNVRASSEPRETSGNSLSNGYESKSQNVGYVSLAYDDSKGDNKHLDELSEIDNEIMNFRQVNDETVPTSPSDTSASESGEARKKLVYGRPSTPSFIPRPMTPKISRKMSVPESNALELSVKQEEREGRPPTPKKPNVIARAPGGVRSTERSKEQTYRQIFQKRSMTPGPGSSSTTSSRSTSVTRPERRSSTPGPYLQKSSQLSATSATTTRARLNQTMDQKRNRTASSSSSVDNHDSRPSSRPLSRQGSGEQTEHVITVNRSGGQHSLTVHNRTDSPKTVNKAKVLARARTEDNRARQQTRPQTLTRQRPQSVEPRQLMPRKNSATGQVLSVKRNDSGQHEVYDRTEEWVQTAVKETNKTNKTKPARSGTAPRMRRAMTPNSFDMKLDLAQEEPRSLEEIKAALTLPINGMVTPIDTEQLEPPPEDAEMYATMEKLFHELRQQELKASVNETPGSITSSKKSSKSKSNSSNNDEDISLDSNKNVKRKTLSASTKSSSNVTSPSLSRHNKPSVVSIQSEQTHSGQQPVSRTSSASSSASRPSPGRQQPPRPSSPRTATYNSNSITPRTPVGRPSSPKTFIKASSPSTPGRPSSPSPRVVTNQRPPSPRTASRSSRPESPRLDSQPPRPSSPKISTRRSPSPTPVSRQPPRPASTPPRPCTPVDRMSSSKSSDDSGVVSPEAKTESSLISKIKEIIKVKPRKDKAEGVKAKSRIPAPKSLSSAGKSKSFSNLSNLSDSMSLAHTDTLNIMIDDGIDQNGYCDQINGGLNVTLSGRSETPKPKLITPMTTGRSTLIRKESMDKNKTSSRLSRAMSVERDMSGLQNTYQFYEEGEYV